MRKQRERAAPVADGPVVLATYRDQVITVDSTGFFSCTLPGSTRATSKRELDELKKAIDSYATRQQKSRKLELAIIYSNRDHEVLLGTVTGISLHTDRVTGVGEYPGELWPDVPWIRDRLGKRWVLMQEVREIEHELNPYQIDSGRGRHPIDYGEKLDELEAEYTEKFAAAYDAENAR